MGNRKEFRKRAKEKEKELKKQLEEEGGVSKKDMLAMIGAAFVTIFPICAIILIGLGLLMLWLFGAI